MSNLTFSAGRIGVLWKDSSGESYIYNTVVNGVTFVRGGFRCGTEKMEFSIKEEVASHVTGIDSERREANLFPMCGGGRGVRSELEGCCQWWN